MKLSGKLFILFFLVQITGSAQHHLHEAEMAHNALHFIKNKGQWDSKVLYRAPLGTGSVYLENNGFTYSQVSAEDIDHAHNHAGDADHDHQDMVHGHVWKANFIGANASPKLIESDIRTEYHNYFIGNDPTKWASRVPLFDHVSYDELYNGIDLDVYSVDGNFKYDFVVAPNTDPSIIKIKYSGLNGLELRDGNLISITSIGEYVENAPYVYQLIDGVKTQIACNFTLENGVVGFEFPSGYDSKLPLIIDPTLIGATLSGGTVTNFGHCATYDRDENIYTGARCFGTGYPATVGAFETTFGGEVDIAISKLSPNATSLIYATYLGGAGQDLAHSMYVSEDREMYVLGTSYSVDYPTSGGAFDATGPLGGANRDIVVTHLTEDGTAVVGSTFVGGNSDDGGNSITYNYGDTFRGEIIVDIDGNCYIASCTVGSDFPTTVGAYQTTYGGGVQDAVIFSMPPNLSTMNWSTYLGGASGEAGFGLRLNDAGDLYVSGACQSNFMTATGYQTTYQGGGIDAYCVKLIDDGSSIEYSTYYGTTASDAAFFIDIDVDGSVYLYGQSDGGIAPVTLGVYSNPLSDQFICKLSGDLETLEFGTVVGNGGANFVPIAFMVDACEYVYFSGHSASFGLPLVDPLYPTGGMYLGVLEPDAVAMEFSTYYSGNHVDGGTSRFDPKNGTVYQAVCSCEPFTTTPGAFGTVPGGFCDMAVFKIDFGISHVNANAEALPSAEGCVPFTVDFDNTGTGITYQWDFGDGSPLSTEFEPSHTFTEPGIYEVRLVAFDPEGCLTSDTTYLEIIVGSGETPEASFDYEVNCATGEVTITFTGTDGVPTSYDMGDGSTYDTPDVSHTYDADGTYTITLTAGDGVCADEAVFEVDISIGTPSVDVIFSNPTCYGFSDGSITLDLLAPTGEELIEIKNGAGDLLNVGGSNTANTLTSGWYYFRVDLGGGCELIDSIQLFDPPAINAQLRFFNPLCYGDETGYVVVDTVFNWQGDYDELVFIWSPDPPVISGVGADSLYNLAAGNYILTINDGNGCSQVIEYSITQPTELVFSEFGKDPAYCRLFGYQSGNGVVFAAAIGGTPDYDYLWENLDNGETSVNSTWGGLNPGNYRMTVTDANGCQLIQTVLLDSLNPISQFTVTIDQLKTDCDAVVPVDINFTNQSLNYANPNDPFADTTFLWNFNYDINPWVISHDINESYDITFTQSGTYDICLIALNKNGCKDTSCQELILCDPLVFVPVNIFSPDGNGQNDEFTFYHRSDAVKEFYCTVVNRWGVTIAEFNNVNDGWNGTDKQGNKVPDGVYFYTYAGKADTGEEFSGQGTVTLVNGKE